jgi:hypothetical protein
MSLNDSRIRSGAPGTCDLVATLSTFVEAVQFFVMVDDEAVKGLVLAEVLVDRFGALDSPAGWLIAFELHRSEIVASALRCRRAGRRTVVVNEACFREGD